MAVDVQRAPSDFLVSLELQIPVRDASLQHAGQRGTASSTRSKARALEAAFQREARASDCARTASKAVRL